MPDSTAAATAFDFHIAFGEFFRFPFFVTEAFFLGAEFELRNAQAVHCVVNQIGHVTAAFVDTALLLLHRAGGFFQPGQGRLFQAFHQGVGLVVILLYNRQGAFGA